MNGITPASTTVSLPTFVFAAFQMAFATITVVALISGSVTERMKFISWLFFSLLFAIFVYAPIAHRVWGGGFLSKLNVLDFAGGTVVHINAGVAGLVLALTIGEGLQKSSRAAFFCYTYGPGCSNALVWMVWLQCGQCSYSECIYLQQTRPLLLVD